MRKFFIKLADTTKPDSLAVRLRRKRFSLFIELVDSLTKKLNRPLNILDVGGTEIFWQMMQFLSYSQHKITLLNLTETPTNSKNIISVSGDARNMEKFTDKEFDIAFSNSVIEHLGTKEDQIQMAKEIQRVALSFYIQTPSYFFPFEPHFMFPFFHWFPRRTRIWLVKNFDLGWFQKTNNHLEAANLVDEIRLMKYSELKTLFPDANIIREKFLGFTKSYIVIKS